MYLSNIKLWNFRKYGSSREIEIDKPDLDLNFTRGLNVIIGENDSGKTAILDAIKLVLKTHSYDFIRVEHKDFYNGSDRFRIELIFSGLESEEAKNFTEWLAWSGSGTEAKPYLKIQLDVKKQGEKILPTDIKAGIDDDGYLLTAEAKEYLKVTYLKPLRDAENELVAKRNSRLSQILLGDPAFKGREKDHELVRIFESLSTELNKYFKGEFKVFATAEDGKVIVDEEGNDIFELPDGGKKIKDKIDGYIQSFYGANNESLFNASSNNIKSILEKLTLLLKDETNPGLGTLNRLFMAAELLHLNKEHWSGIRLGLIEEIEAHLHPQAQMQVIEALQKQDAIQLILTTHSPNLASKLKLENLIICNRGNAFPMGSSYTKLASGDYTFLEKFLDTTKANLFFAKGLILVEGWAEEILISSIANHIGINLTEKGISIINVGNLAFARYVNIFLRNEAPYMGLPVAVITDSDVAEYIVSNSAYSKVAADAFAQRTDEKLCKIAKRSKRNVNYFAAPQWTLEYSLYKSASLSAILQATTLTTHSKMSPGDNFELELAKKLLKKTLKKTEIAYRMAKLIDDDAHLAKEERTIAIDPDDKDDSVHYIIKAIRYAAGN